MANFIGRLGAFAPAVLDIAAPFGAVGGSEDATLAMQRLLQQYADLSARGEKLRQILTTGATIPCAVWDAYNQACLDYLQKGQVVFDQLTQRGISVEQVAYSGGKPVSDPNVPGQYRTLRVAAPLRPPAFTFVQSQCPSVANFQGWVGGWRPVPISGWQPIPIELGAVSDAILASFKFSVFFLLTGPAGIAGAVGVGGTRALTQIAVSVMAYLESPKQIIDAYTTCFDRQVAAGIKADAAGQRCFDVQQSAQSYAATRPGSGGWGFWTWMALGGAVLVAGGALALYLRRRALGLLTLHDWEPPVHHLPPRRRRRTRQR